MASARIAYVDDDQDLTELVKRAMEEEGYQVLTANDGEEGLELILTEAPDLIILDVMMPKLNGWEVARYLRSKLEWADTPILMLTGIGKTLNDMTAPLYGATDHLDKPFDFDELVVKVRSLLKE
jgi:two-component system response regulator MprA